MSPGEVRILFDERIPGPKLSEALKFLGPNKLHGILVMHLFEIAPRDARDEDWIPRLREGRWTVVSADGGKRPNKGRGKKLPLLCAEYGHTLIWLSSKIHHRKADDKIRTILSIWDEIVMIAADPAKDGKRYNLEPLNPENLGIGRLVERKLIRPSEGP